MSNIHPTAFVDDGAHVHPAAEIGPFCYVGSGVKIGEGTKLISHVSLTGQTTIGCGNILYPQSVIGIDPQDLMYQGEPTRLIIGDENHIREGVSIHRGTMKEEGITQIGSRCFIMAFVHIGHDSVVGDDVLIGNGTQIAGHCRIEDHAHVAGMCGLHQFVTVGDAAYVAAMTRVIKDVPPYTIVEGHSTKVHKINTKLLKQLDMDDASIERLRQTHRLLFRRVVEDEITPTFQQASQKVKELYADDEHVMKLLTSCEQAAASPTGRSRQPRHASGPAQRQEQQASA